MKTCSMCGIEKSTDDFYKHATMKDGFLKQCKECHKKTIRENRAANVEHYREYDRKRAKTPARKKAANQISRLWLQADSRRTRCHNAVTRAVRKGTLIRKPCEQCSSEKTLAHHESYDHPLVVVWLCQPCHKQRHKEMVIAGIEP